MTSLEVREQCENLPSATFELKEEWGSELGRVADKMFAMYGHDNQDRRILTLKVVPEAGDDLRAQYPDFIVEGYYMNKRHWISILMDSEVDDQLVKDLIKQSYDLIVAKLPKRVRETL